MQSARYPGYEVGRLAGRPDPSDRRSDRGARPPAAVQTAIIRALAAWGNGGGAEVLVYGAPEASPTETHY